MKILRVITRMNIGGPAHQVNYLHRALRHCGHEVHLVIGSLDSGEGDAGGELLGMANVEHIPQLCRPIRPLSDALAFFKIWQLLCREPYDVCHSHTAKAGLLTRLAALLAKPWRKLKKYPKLKIVHTYHGHVFQGYFSPRMSKWVCLAERFLAGHSDVLITLTPLLRREIASHLNVAESKLKIVPLGLDLKAFLNVKREAIFEAFFELENININNINNINKNINIDIKEHIPLAQLENSRLNAKANKPSIVGWVGRFSSIKNPLRFLDMAEILIKLSDRPIVFVMVGDGPLRTNIEADLQRRNLAHVFYLTGWRSDLTTVYRGFDALINTSDNEGTPVAVLEALCSGLPVAATNVGGTAEILSLLDQPVLCYDKENFASACQQILPWLLDHRRLDAHARQNLVLEFSQDKLLKNLLKIYGENT